MERGPELTEIRDSIVLHMDALQPTVAAASLEDTVSCVQKLAKEAAKLAEHFKLQVARERSQAWLKRHGDPYVTSVMDLDGRVGINYGVYGVPETYVIDQQGIIRYKYVGAVTPQLLADKILPLINKLTAS